MEVDFFELSADVSYLQAVALKHLATDPKENSEFCFHKTFNVP